MSSQSRNSSSLSDAVWAAAVDAKDAKGNDQKPRKRGFWLKVFGRK